MHATPKNLHKKIYHKRESITICTERFAKGIAEVADDVAKVIRSSSAYDWEKILPAVGKRVATELNINPSDDMSNYIASWFIDGAPNDNSAEAQEFQKAMREADDMYRNQLLEVREIFDEWNKRTPEEIVRDTIAHGKPEKPLTEKARGFFDDGYGQFVEELYPIKQLVDAFEEELHRKLTDEENPYVLLRNFATVYNPAFALRNLVMDDQNAMLYSKYGFFSPVDFVKGFLSVFNRDADFQEWMAMGAARRQVSGALTATTLRQVSINSPKANGDNTNRSKVSSTRLRCSANIRNLRPA